MSDQELTILTAAEEVRLAVAQVIEETEDYDDALGYMEEIAIEFEVSQIEVVNELRRQMNLPPEEPPCNT